MSSEELRRQKARNFRYKKPLMRNMSLDEIRTWIYEVGEQIGDVQWFIDDEANLLNALDGDEDEAYAFRAAFSSLAAEVEQFENDLQEEWVPECFDDLFPAVSKPGMFGGMLGWDEYEQDYYGLSDYEFELGKETCEKRICRMSKKDIIEAVSQCLKIYASFVALQYRYDCLEASLDIIRGQNLELTKVITGIDKQYKIAEEATDGFRFVNNKEVYKLDSMLLQIPQEYWVQ